MVGLGLLLVASGRAVADEDPVERRARQDRSLTYYLQVPRGTRPADGWPLFIFVHGTYASGVGDFKLWRQYADPEGFLLLTPNFTGEFDRFPQREDEELLRLIKQLDVEHGVDERKILLGGFSRGGVFVFRFAFAHPSIAQVVAILNGAPYLPRVDAGAGPHQARFYLSAGSEEPSTAERARATADMLRRRGYAAEAHIDKGFGHTISPQAVLDVLRLFRQMTADAPAS